MSSLHLINLAQLASNRGAESRGPLVSIGNQVIGVRFKGAEQRRLGARLFRKPPAMLSVHHPLEDGGGDSGNLLASAMPVFNPDPVPVLDPEPCGILGMEVRYRLRMYLAKLRDMPVLGVEEDPGPAAIGENKGVLLGQLGGADGAFRGLLVIGKRVHTYLLKHGGI
jgi:hypothetical protein